MRITPVCHFSPVIKQKNGINFRNQRVLHTPSIDTVCFQGTKKNENPSRVVILLGAPNSGKGTLAREISSEYKIPQISTGDILRNEVKNQTDLGLEAKSYMNSGGLVPDQLIMQILKKRISEKDCEKGFILDGFPRTIQQAKELNEILKDKKNLSVKIINLDVDESILYERSSNRYMCEMCSKTQAVKEYDSEKSKCECGGRLIKRKDDTPDVLKKRLENYNAQTLPLLDFYGKDVNNIEIYDNGITVSEIFEETQNILDD